MEAIITIGKGVIGENIPKALIQKVKKDLTFENPEYVNAMKFGKFLSADMPSHLHLHEIEGKNCWVPRGYIYYFLKWFHDHKKKYKIRDKTLLLKPLDLKFIKELRPYQEKAIPDLMGYPCGVLEGDTGSGKTIIALYMMVKRQQPTMIIVHSKELLYQWEERIKEFTGEQCGLLGDGNNDIRHITVGIINSVRNHIKRLKNLFGHVICDECHRVITWADTIAEFTARYFLGCTATPFRNDGLGKAIFAILGPLRHKVDEGELRKTKSVLVPKIFRMPTNFSYMFLNDYSTMITSLIEDVQRNTILTNAIARDLKKHNENILIVSDRTKHLQIMQKMLFKKYGIRSHVLTGKTKTKDRKRIIANIKSGICKILFASGSLIGEGFDAPELAALFLGTPVKFSGKLLQVAGRILRPKKGKVARLYDPRDNKVPVLEYSGYHRDRVYRKKGW